MRDGEGERWGGREDERERGMYEVEVMYGSER